MLYQFYNMLQFEKVYILVQHIFPADLHQCVLQNLLLLIYVCRIYLFLLVNT
jgi:hypothetical protein